MPPWPGEARDKPLLNGIGHPRKHDRDRRGSLLGSARTPRRRDDDDLHLEPDQLGHESGEPFGLPLRPSVFDDDVLALHPAQRTQPLPKGVEEVPVHGSRAGLDKAYAWHLPRRLRVGGARRAEEAEGEGGDEPDGADATRWSPPEYTCVFTVGEQRYSRPR